jgi:anti-sigma B factor antagonist
MQIQSYTIDSTVVLDLNGRFDNYTAPAVATWFDQALATLAPQIVINLAGVDFVDSTALATLVRGLKRCKQRNGELYLCGLQAPVYMIFELARLDRAFTIFANVDHAIQSSQGQSS